MSDEPLTTDTAAGYDRYLTTRDALIALTETVPWDSLGIAYDVVVDLLDAQFPDVDTPFVDVPGDVAKPELYRLAREGLDGLAQHYGGRVLPRLRQMLDQSWAADPDHEGTHDLGGFR